MSFAHNEIHGAVVIVINLEFRFEPDWDLSMASLSNARLANEDAANDTTTPEESPRHRG
jgi:hypothetical protein